MKSSTLTTDFPIVRRAPLYFCIAFLRPEADVGGVAEACLRFTPDLTVRRGERPAIFLEASRCLALYTPEKLVLRLRVCLREWGFAETDYRIARASSLPRAWLCGREGIPESAIDAAPVAGIGALLDPLGENPDEMRKVSAMVEMLFMLGVRRIGGVRKLPPDSAIARFGALYSCLLERLVPETVVEDFPWARFRPTEKFIERVDLDPDDTIWDLEPTLFHAKTLLDRVLKRAFGRGKALVVLELRIECERRRNRREVFIRVPIRFTFPQSDGAVVLRTLREKLGFEFGRRELEAPIAALELEALELAPRRALQSDFVDPEQSAEGFRELIAELGTKLEAEKEVFQAELAAVWRPERSWNRVLKEPSAVAAIGLPIPERPLELLDPPEPLRRLGRYFFRGELRYVIESSSQIERLSGEWWEADGGFTRTYYRVRVRTVEDESREFWIFREQRRADEKGGLFLHGIY
ncbi:MAG: hypothetical protein JST04_16570 [Bdellovibrionales bacterium]|nr:hypothetical protein [Bdellovibrionales bacterium]